MSKNRRQHPKRGATTIQTRTIDATTYKVINDSHIYSVEISSFGIQERVVAPFFRLEDALKACKNLMKEQVAAE